MNLVRRVVDILIGRLIATVGTMFATRLDTLAALEHAEQQDELEERARRFEDEGKTHLADVLRSRAAEISTENPNAMGHDVICQLGQQQTELEKQHTQLEPPQIGLTTSEDAGESVPSGGSEPKSRRPAKRRTCRRAKTD